MYLYNSVFLLPQDCTVNIPVMYTYNSNSHSVKLTYSGDESGVKRVLTESKQQTRLAHPAVSDEQQFEQIVVRFRHVSCFSCLATLLRIGSRVAVFG